MMNRNLNYMIMREIISCFVEEEHFVEENDVINYLLIQLNKNKGSNKLDKMTLDFNIVYILLDLLESLGFVNRKLEMNQKFLTWKGFPGFYAKHSYIFLPYLNDPEQLAHLQIPIVDKTENKYLIEGLCFHFLIGLLTAPGIYYIYIY